MEPFAINYREGIQISQVDCGLMANFTVWIEKGYKHTEIRYLLVDRKKDCSEEWGNKVSCSDAVQRAKWMLLEF